MDPELIFLLIIIFGPAIARWLGVGKKEGPTGKTLPPVERPPRPATRPRPSRTSRSAEPQRGGAAGRPAGGTDDRPWREAEPDQASTATAGSARRPADAEQRPWWETPENALPERSAPDPWRNDPDRPQGPILKSPEDLWEILTGERLPFPQPQPEARPEPASVGFPSSDPRAPRPVPVGDRDVVSLEGESLEATDISLEGVSLEATEISGEARHAAFHRLIDRPRPTVRRRGAMERLGLEKRSDVRRAIVLAEVLGKPRSMAPPDR